MENLLTKDERTARREDERQGGFTIIETVIAMCIALVVGMIVNPPWRSSSRRAVRSSFVNKSSITPPRSVGDLDADVLRRAAIGWRHADGEIAAVVVGAARWHRRDGDGVADDRDDQVS